MIIHPEQLIDSVVRISCGDEHGTGFFISPKQALTAWHVISDYFTEKSEIIIERSAEGQPNFKQMSAIVIDTNADLDIAILEIVGEQDVFEGLTITLNQIRYNEEWTTFGYPFTKLMDGYHLSGVVRNFTRNLAYDIALSSEQIDTNVDYSGLSGSPLVVFGRVVGLITWGTVNGLGAISVKKISDFLIKNQLSIEQPHESGWSNDYLDEIGRAVTNDGVIERLKAAVKAGGQYYLLDGSPGSGKSIIASTIEFNSHFTVLGRYIIRMPGDLIPVYVKATRENFMQWIEDLVCKILTGEPAAKDITTWTERLKRLSGWITELSMFLSPKKQNGVIIVDGLDEILLHQTNSLDEFLGVLPEDLPPNLSVLLSCTSAEILPIRVSSKLLESQKVNVTPLSKSATSSFLYKESIRLGISLTATEIALIADKSEGHPLYLRYLIETLKNTPPDNLEHWIAQLPTIGGDIQKYYEILWSGQIAADSDKYWITLLAAQLREPVKFEEFKSMLPKEAIYQFESKFPAIRHLFKNGVMVSIYHNSFERFIAQKGRTDVKNAHQYISDFNVSGSRSIYSLKNLLHHILLSNNPTPAIAACNQEWADSCALVHMEPDLIIGDIKLVEALCIDDVAVSELIRIKLLLQRLRFRYDNVLAKHAFEISKALIQMGNSKDALKYILREDLLLVSFDSAIYFLQKLYETEAYEEAASLFNAINLRITRLLETEEEEGIDPNLIIIRQQLFTLGINSDESENMMGRFISGMDLLKRIQNHSTAPAGQMEHVLKIREYVSAWNLGYFIYRYNHYPGIEKMAEISDEIYSNSTAQHLAQAAINYFRFKSIGHVSPHDEQAYHHLIRDIEKLIKEHGYREEDADLLIKTLIEESTDSSLVEGIIKKHFKKKPKYIIRKADGVTADLEALVAAFNDGTFLGYIDTLNVFPTVAARDPNNWELFFVSAYELIGFLTGKSYRLRAEDRLEEIIGLEKEARLLVNKCRFKLQERVSFENSYAIIEQIMPLLFQRIGGFYAEFQSDNLDWFISFVLDSGQEQLGMYTEGYREALALMAERLSEQSLDRKQTFRLVNALENHTYFAVQNRWERTPELLNIITLYAKIGAVAKAKFVYRQMLNTSMGPSWYKESQFALINSALRHVESTDSKNYYADFAGALEYASGEMTFQRYVQHEMHAFVGSLTASGRLSKAIEYFEYQVLPAPEVILANAESSSVDAPKVGDGYILGARSIIEAATLIDLLGAVVADPLIVLALSEVFLIGSDTERYLRSFVQIQHSAFSSASAMSNDLGNIVLKRIAVIASQFDENERSNYLVEVFNTFTESIDILKKFMVEAGVNEDELPQTEVPRSSKKLHARAKQVVPHEDNQQFELPGIGKIGNFSKISEAVEQADQEFFIGNFDEGRKILMDCLVMLHNGRSDIWQGRHLTAELGNLFESLKANGSVSEILHLLKELIIDHSTDDWRVADFLIKLLHTKLDKQEREGIIDAVRGHIEFLIRSQWALSDKYAWLNGDIDEVSSEEQLIRFMVWLMNHPYKSIHDAVFNALIWLAEFNSKVLTILIESSLDCSREVANESSAGLLYILSDKQPNQVALAIQEQSSLASHLQNVDHFMISVYWLDILTNCRNYCVDIETLYEMQLKQFPTDIVTAGDVYLDHKYLTPVTELLDNLNDLGVLSRKFCEQLITNVENYSKPLTPVDQLRIERYIKRSFYEEEHWEGHYRYLLRSAINNALVGKVSYDQIKPVRKIIELNVL